MTDAACFALLLTALAIPFCLWPKTPTHPFFRQCVRLFVQRCAVVSATIVAVSVDDARRSAMVPYFLFSSEVNKKLFLLPLSFPRCRSCKSTVPELFCSKFDLLWLFQVEFQLLWLLISNCSRRSTAVALRSPYTSSLTHMHTHTQLLAGTRTPTQNLPFRTMTDMEQYTSTCVRAGLLLLPRLCEWVAEKYFLPVSFPLAQTIVLVLIFLLLSLFSPLV